MISVGRNRVEASHVTAITVRPSTRIVDAPHVRPTFKEPTQLKGWERSVQVDYRDVVDIPKVTLTTWVIALHLYGTQIDVGSSPDRSEADATAAKIEHHLRNGGAPRASLPEGVLWT